MRSDLVYIDVCSDLVADDVVNLLCYYHHISPPQIFENSGSINTAVSKIDHKRKELIICRGVKSAVKDGRA